MACGERRKCKCCLKLFRPDPRNRRHQRYCSALACRAASKAASQARWLAAPENQDYFPRRGERRRSRRGGRATPGIGARVDVSACVTRCLNGATPWFRSKTDNIAGRRYKMFNRATCCSDWPNRPYGGDAVQDDIVRTVDRLLRLAETFSLHRRCGRQRRTAEPS